MAEVEEAAEVGVMRGSRDGRDGRDSRDGIVDPSCTTKARGSSKAPEARRHGGGKSSGSKVCTVITFIKVYLRKNHSTE